MKPRLIAEVGSNWKTKEDCLRLIELASSSKADAVKFQLFTEKELYGLDTGKWTTGRPPVLDRAWIADLASHAHSFSLEFMCTAFSPDGYEFINEHVQTHKIASAEITDLSIIETVASFKKPVLLSTGGATEHEIDIARYKLVKNGCNVTVMLCDPQYPSPGLDLKKLYQFRNCYFNIGYSDHTRLTELPIEPGFFTWIEKHVNFLDYTDTPDAWGSLSLQDFTKYADSVKTEKDFDKPFVHKRVWNKELKGYFRPLSK